MQLRARGSPEGISGGPEGYLLSVHGEAKSSVAGHGVNDSAMW